MIGYVTLGSNDIDKARSFSSALLGTIGGKELMRLDHSFPPCMGRAWASPSSLWSGHTMASRRPSAME